MCISGCFLTVQPTVLVDLMGVERIARSQAFVNIFQGTGSLVGVPLAGKQYKIEVLILVH